jgi:hypothetical protein
VASFRQWQFEIDDQEKHFSLVRRSFSGGGWGRKILKIVLDKELTISLYQDLSLQRGPLMTVSLDGGGNGTV